MYRLSLFVIAFAITLCSAFAEVNMRTVSSHVVQSKETLTIKNKLAKAEGRVGDLISRLDSVQDDATRTKDEIHSTLLEVWKIVDMLGQDRCGEVVDKVRITQKKAENKVIELQEEVSVHLKDIEGLKLQHVQHGDSYKSLQKEITTERSRRELLEAETRELRDKLHWASAVSNETQAYEVVAERLQGLFVVVNERTQLLQRILTMVADSHSGFNDWRAEIDTLTKLVRDAERDFSGGYQSAAVEGMRKHSLDLEKRLKDALRVKESATYERNSLQKTIDGLQKKITNSPFNFAKTRDRIIVQAEGGTSAIGVITLCVISLCTGAVAVFFLGLWQNNRDISADDTAEPYDFTPTASRTSPGFSQNSVGRSPLEYSNTGSASKTPASRGSTPRRY